MSEPFLGQISIVGFNFAPRGWAQCNGQLIPIPQNTALFALLGTTYGGNGQTNYALPDLRGRAPMSFGNGVGLTPRSLGEATGAESVTLLPGEMPTHTHVVSAQSSRADRGNALGAQLAATADATYSAAPPSSTLAAGSVTAAGGGFAHNNMQPFLTLNFIIALEGIFPARN
jgi:microcystin-dependent protein